MRRTKIFTILALAIVGLITYKGSCVNLPANTSNISAVKINEMQEKKCTKCGDVKLLSEFNKRKASKDGLSFKCRLCATEELRIYRIENGDRLLKSYNEYRHTKKGVISVIYSTQNNSSRHRNHPLPTYTQNELEAWLFSQEIFHILYDYWAASGYDRYLKPSCDRTDDYQGYSLDRLRVVTWKENEDKRCSDMVNGVNNKQSKAVISTNINTGEKVEYYSISNAARELGIQASGICQVCRNNPKYSQCGGYYWDYKNITQ